MTDSKYLPAFNGWLRTMGEDVLSLANLLEAPDAPEPFRQASAESLHYLLRSAELIPEGLEALGYLEGAVAFRAIAERALVDGPEGRLAGDDLGASDELEPGAAEPRERRDASEPSEPEATDESPFGSSEDETVEPSADEAFARHEDGPVGLGADGAVDPTEGGPVGLGEPDAIEPSADEAFARREDGPVEPRAGRGPVPTEGRVPRLAADVALIREFLGEDMPRLFTLVLTPAATTRAGRAAAELMDDDELRSTTLRDARRWVERYRAPELRSSAEELVKLRSFFRTRLRREP